jgi:hypothetical protein
MPALRQAEMASTERDLGPSVPTIFVMAGKKLGLDGSRMETIRMGSSRSRLVECIFACSEDRIGGEVATAAGSWAALPSFFFFPKQGKGKGESVET